MSTYFDPSINRVPIGSLAKSEQVNNLRDEVGVFSDMLPEPDVLSSGKTTYGADTGIADAYAVALPTTALAYVLGMLVDFIPANANTGVSTLNVDSLGTVAIKRPDGSDLESGDLTTDNPISLRYNGTDFRFTGSSPISFFADAEASADAAALSETNAKTSETNSLSNANTAGGYASAAATSANEASAWLNLANQAAFDAAASAAAAELDSISANSSAAAAFGYKNDAFTSKTAAETAETNAGLSADAAAASAATLLTTKVINIGAWNMDTAATKTVTHGLTFTDIRTMTMVILNDASSAMFNDGYAVDGVVDAWVLGASTTTVTLSRRTGGFFDQSTFTVLANRGYLVIEHV